MTSITINIDAEDLRIIRIALIDAWADTETRRQAHEGIEQCADLLTDLTHRVEVLESVRAQIHDQELKAMLSKVTAGGLSSTNK